MVGVHTGNKLLCVSYQPILFEIPGIKTLKKPTDLHCQVVTITLPIHLAVANTEEILLPQLLSAGNRNQTYLNSQHFRKTLLDCWIRQFHKCFSPTQSDIPAVCSFAYHHNLNLKIHKNQSTGMPSRTPTLAGWLPPPPSGTKRDSSESDGDQLKSITFSTFSDFLSSRPIVSVSYTLMAFLPIRAKYLSSRPPAHLYPRRPIY